MTSWADITVGTVWDGDIVTKREVFSGGEWEYVRLTTKTGGVRTETADFPVDALTNVRIAHPMLVDVPDDQLLIGAGVFADQVREGFTELLDGLHDVALELHRRRALRCVERGCWWVDAGCVCHRR